MTLLRARIADPEQYLYALPAVRYLDTLDFHPKSHGDSWVTRNAPWLNFSRMKTPRTLSEWEEPRYAHDERWKLMLNLPHSRECGKRRHRLVFAIDIVNHRIEPFGVAFDSQDDGLLFHAVCR